MQKLIGWGYSAIIVVSDKVFLSITTIFEDISEHWFSVMYISYSIVVFIFRVRWLFSQLIMSFISWLSEMHTWKYVALATLYENK